MRVQERFQIMVGVLWAGLIALHTVHPILPVMLIFLVWAASLGVWLALAIHSPRIKHPFRHVAANVIVLTSAVGVFAYQTAGWNGVVWALLQVANLVDYAFVVALVVGFLVFRAQEKAIDTNAHVVRFPQK